MTGPFEDLPELAAWLHRGSPVEVFGHRLFTLDTGPSDLPNLLLLHGFPSCSFDFHRVLPSLAERFRVVVHDHLGFGFSAKPRDYSYSLLEQAETAVGLWRQLGIDRGHLLAHDYGTSVATELLARRERGLLPVELESITLCNGSIHLDLAHLTVAQRLMRSHRLGPIFTRLVNQRFFHRRMRRLWGDPEKAREKDLAALWRGIEHGGGRLRLVAISSYLHERVRFQDRWIGALARLDLPTRILWGRKDPVAVPAIAEALAAEIPGARLTWLEDLGHYPMLEDPETWVEAVLASGWRLGERGCAGSTKVP